MLKSQFMCLIFFSARPVSSLLFAQFMVPVRMLPRSFFQEAGWMHFSRIFRMGCCAPRAPWVLHMWADRMVEFVGSLLLLLLQCQQEAKAEDPACSQKDDLPHPSSCACIRNLKGHSKIGASPVIPKGLIDPPGSWECFYSEFVYSWNRGNPHRYLLCCPCPPPAPCLLIICARLSSLFQLSTKI